MKPQTFIGVMEAQIAELSKRVEKARKAYDRAIHLLPVHERPGMYEKALLRELEIEKRVRSALALALEQYKGLLAMDSASHPRGTAVMHGEFVCLAVRGRR